MFRPRRFQYASKTRSLAKLKTAGSGYGPSEMMNISKALSAKLGPQVRLSTGFQNDSTPDCEEIIAHSNEKFKHFVGDMQISARYYIPIGVRNHALGCIVDIDALGKASILIFDSLGSSDSYKNSYEFFITTLQERFPHLKVIKTTKKFQHLEKDDYLCGDWVFWFLKEASAKQQLPLENIKKHFDEVQMTPNSADLRNEHIALLRENIAKYPSEKDIQIIEMEIKSSEDKAIVMEPYPDEEENEASADTTPLNPELAEKLTKALLDVFDKLQLLLEKIEAELDRMIELAKKETNDVKPRESTPSDQGRVSAVGKFKNTKVTSEEKISSMMSYTKRNN